MAAVAYDQIPSKFISSIINRDDFENPFLQRMVERAFGPDVGGRVRGYFESESDSESDKDFLTPTKRYVYTKQSLPNFVIKTKRDDAIAKDLAEDTHLYRVRKAKKIQKLIDAYKLGDFVEVPRKYLYFHSGKWHVIARKIELSDEVPKVRKESFGGPEMMFTRMMLGSRIDEALEDSAKPISEEQARALVIFAYEAGLTDLTFMNLYYTKEGKLAIVDTEPVDRGVVKATTETWYGKLFIDKTLFKAFTAVNGVSKLRHSITDDTAMAALNRCENYYLAKHTIIAVAKIALLIVAMVFATYTPFGISFCINAAFGLRFYHTTYQTGALLYFAFTKRDP